MAHLEYIVSNRMNEFKLTKTDTLIGRSDSCSLQLLHDSEISRVHCCIQKQADNSYMVLDEGAKNGTFVNGRRIVNEEFGLRDGDEVQIGKTVLTFRDRHEVPAGGRTDYFFKEIANEMEEGKGFHTIMSEIVGKKK